MSAGMNSVAIFHINLNVTDLEAATGFYHCIGFRTLLEFPDTPGFAEIGLPEILRVPDDCTAKARFLILGDDLRATRLDLIQWTRPATGGRVPDDRTAVGVARICLRVRDARAMHDRLCAAGYSPFAPPRIIDMGGTRQRVFCCPDPDGFTVEFMEFVKDRADEP